MKHLVFYDSLVEDFTHENEDLDQDISGVCITMIKNIHDKSIEMSVEIFGKDGLEEPAITSDIVFDPEAYLGKAFHRTTICPRCLMRIFDKKLRAFFIEQNVKIYWNRNWQTRVVIDPANLHHSQDLLAEEQ